MQAGLKNPVKIIWLTAALLALPALTPPARADEHAPLQRFLDCRSIKDNTARLACFDGAADALTAPAKVAPPETPVTEKQAVEESFGHEALPATRQADDKRTQEYRAKVTVFSTDAYGNLILVLENGQVWRQTDGQESQLLTGEQWVTIHRAFMGSYLITIESTHRTYRFKRVK